MSGYWDIPDGTDCARKAWLTGRLGAAMGVWRHWKSCEGLLRPPRTPALAPGLLGSAFHIVLFQPDTALQGVQRATTSTVTMATLGAIFGVTTCLSAQIRDEPEDPLNYFIGGCASGTVLGARAHSFATGMSACVSLGLLAAFTKIGKKEGWRIVGTPRL